MSFGVISWIVSSLHLVAAESRCLMYEICGYHEEQKVQLANLGWFPA
jgi:hypothetical protein